MKSWTGLLYFCITLGSAECGPHQWFDHQNITTYRSLQNYLILFVKLHRFPEINRKTRNGHNTSLTQSKMNSSILVLNLINPLVVKVILKFL